MRAKEIKLVTSGEENKGIAALIIQKIRVVGKGGTNEIGLAE